MKNIFRLIDRNRGRFAILVLLVASTTIAGVAGTVVTQQSDSGANGPNRTTQSSTSNTKGKFTTMRVAGQDVQVDPQTGQIQGLTPDEAQRLAEGLKRLINPSAKGAHHVRHEDGSISINVDGRFQNVTVARINRDGTVDHACVDTPESAGAFFGIDPKLIERQSVATMKQPKSKPE